MKALPLFLLLLAGSACASDADVLKCRALADTGARLACYDAIPVGAKPALAAATPAPVAAPMRNKEESFGMEAKKQREEEPKSITSTIAGEFQGWGPGAQIRLANGQVWRVIDGSEAVLPRTRDPKVTIERNMFGTLFLRVEGTNSSAKVRRVQ
ncbi:hypothetical protein LK542_17760 [Massilia sp. IC2-477]|uniref:hypothetical protein n=1 Tax=Massilia sp. IC2-477 TaxID=2887198 RepID=UPI001D11D009|nr:hypothetical protein [Massilia sp. IC2-477]MCC2957466.1 hypothetical protein [Massilia sp. IC2-477]